MNRIVGQIRPSATLTLAARAREMKRQGKDVVSLTAGEPNFDTPMHIKDAAKRALDENKTRYTALQGIAELREALSAKFERENGIAYDSDEIIVSTGGKQAIYNALRAICNPGDEVIIPCPYWLSYPEQVLLAGARPVFCDTDNGVARADLIAQKITPKTAAIIINTPSNPTGAIIPRDEMERIASLVRDAGCFILSDEVYEHLVYEGVHVSVAGLDGMRDRTITVGSCSKTYAMTGWRIGWAAGPGKVIQAMSRVQSHMTSAPNTIAQYAALAALNGPIPEAMRKAFAKRRRIMMDMLDDAGIGYVRPDGAFYIFADISGSGLSSTDFARGLLDEELVAVVPGEPFGSDKHIRLSYACSDDEIRKGMERIVRYEAKQVQEHAASR